MIMIEWIELISWCNNYLSYEWIYYNFIFCEDKYIYNIDEKSLNYQIITIIVICFYLIFIFSFPINSFTNYLFN